MQFHQLTVNGKHRKVDATGKLASNSELDLKYSPAPQIQAGLRTISHPSVHTYFVMAKQFQRPRLILQPRIDPVKKAVQRLAKKELVSFAAAVRSRICSGKPNKQRDAPGFSQTVDKHIQKFEPYLQFTGAIHCCAVAGFALPAICVPFSTIYRVQVCCQHTLRKPLLL